MSHIFLATTPFFIIVLLAIFFYYSLRWILTYCLTNTDLRVMFLGFIPVSVVPYTNIQSVRQISLKEAFTIGLSVHYGTRIFGNIVLVELRSAWLVKKILYTPDDAATFVRTIQSHINNTHTG